MKNGKEAGRFIPKSETVSYLTDSLTGILKEHYDLDETRMERLKEKHEIENSSIPAFSPSEFLTNEIK